MRAVLRVLLIVALPVLPAAQTPLAVGDLEIAPPQQVTELDMGKLKGEPARLGWSPDGLQMYFQSVEGAYGTPKAVHHYLITLSDGNVKQTPGEPDWFSPYWTLKSHKNSPDIQDLSIELSSEQKKQDTTSLPKGGSLARGGIEGANTMGTSAGDAAAAAYGAQVVTVHSMKLKGQLVGEFTNSVIVPGLTFAWAPQGSQGIAYAQPKGGKLFLMNGQGRTQEVSGTKDVLLPAWSHDAKKLAWLQRGGKKKFALKVTELR